VLPFRPSWVPSLVQSSLRAALRCGRDMGLAGAGAGAGAGAMLWIADIGIAAALAVGYQGRAEGRGEILVD